jgi:3'-5' exoribonuclease
MLLADIKENNQLFANVHALIIKRSNKVTKTEKPFVELLLQHDQLTMKAIKWSYNAEKYDSICVEGNVVKIDGKSNEYDGLLQITIDNMVLSEKQPSDFAKRSRFEVDSMYKVITSCIESITDPMIKYVTSSIHEQYREEFCLSPAATTYHHNWYNGLLEHTYNMASLALRITKHYHSTYGQEHFNKDIVMGGVLLHDIGKIFEYDFSTPAFKKTLEGVLMNHIVKTPILIFNAAEEWFVANGSEETYPRAKFEIMRTHLIHIIASHHGKLEFGAPILPASLEAKLVHEIDMLDSAFMGCLMALESTESGKVVGMTKGGYGSTAYLRPVI